MRDSPSEGKTQVASTTADTIYALSSGVLPSGVAVLRVSGPAAAVVVQALAGRIPEPRRAVLAAFRSAEGEVIDHGLIIWMPGPASFTGEDVAELQVHGGRAVVAAMLAAIGAVPGTRPAERGEFARRAFLSGRLDLTEVEGLADLVAAETEEQRRQALRQASGQFRKRCEAWRGEILRMRAMIEAELDFADEEDVPQAASAAVLAGVGRLAAEIERQIADGGRGERLRRGYEVVLMGPPNAGKSSLLNALCRREAAIVSPEAGTTRDLVEVALDLDGLPVTVVDSAGLRDGGSMVEREGIRRAVDRGEGADLVLWLDPADAPPTWPPTSLDPARLLRIVTKADLIDSDSIRIDDALSTDAVSVVTGRGLDELERRLAARARAEIGSGEEPLITRARHRAALVEAVAGLREAEPPSLPLELRAEGLRHAGDALGRIVGRIGVEDLLDVIFAEFCIGK